MRSIAYIIKKQYLFDDLPKKKNILLKKVLETTWGFSIISTVKLCLVYTILNIYLSTSVASIMRTSQIRRINQLSIN